MGAKGGIMVDLLRLRVYAKLFGLVETEKALRIAILRAAGEVGLETGLSDLQIVHGAMLLSKDPRQLSATRKSPVQADHPHSGRGTIQASHIVSRESIRAASAGPLIADRRSHNPRITILAPPWSQGTEASDSKVRSPGHNFPAVCHTCASNAANSP